MEFDENPPSWAGVLPILLAVLENGTEEGRRIARAELRRMADAADAYNLIKTEN